MTDKGAVASYTRFVRFCHGRKLAYGILMDNAIHRLKGGLFDPPVADGAVFSITEVKLLTPVQPSKIIGVGMNYPGSGNEIPETPILFAKYPSSMIATQESIIAPDYFSKIIGEGELVVVIGKTASGVSVAQAPAHIFGVTIGNDVTGFPVEMPHLLRSKAANTFAPVGPAVAVGLSYAELDIEVRVNNFSIGKGNTRDLVLDVPGLVSHISQYFTLQPGDLVFTGSPALTPELCQGDVVEVLIEGVGTLRNTVVLSSSCLTL